MSLTYEEMKEQYKALRKTFEYMDTKKSDIASFFKDTAPQSVTYLGSGSGYCLCQSGEMMTKVRLGMPSNGFAAGDMMLNHMSYNKFLGNTLVVAPSRSGSTSEVIKAVENMRKVRKTPVVGITCVEKSALSELADLSIELPWAYDESVCQTRTVVNLYTALLLMNAYLSGDNEVIEQVRKVIDAGENFISDNEDKLKEVARDNWSNVVILADGEMQGIAAEGAIAMTEIAQIPGHFYHLLDVRHGPMVLVNKNTLVIAAVNPNDFEYQKSLIEDIQKRGAEVVLYSHQPVDGLNTVRLKVSSHLELENAACGIPFIFIPQAIAYHRAQKEGINPDAPEGLSAWIKL